MDTFYVASFYDCTETLKKDPEIDEVTSEQLLKKVEMKRLTRLARIALEDAIKVIMMSRVVYISLKFIIFLTCWFVLQKSSSSHRMVAERYSRIQVR